MAHTPGQWTWENDEDWHEQWKIIATDTDNGDVIAFVPKSGDEEYDDDVTYANARLIAAAPELLATCEAMLQILSYQKPTGITAAVMLQAQAAIVQAKGQTAEQRG